MSRRVRLPPALLALPVVLAGTPPVRAQTGDRGAIEDEAKVPPYTLPDLLVTADGRPIEDAAAWLRRRRPALLEAFATHVYGRTPRRAPGRVRTRVTSVVQDALGGKAVRKEVSLFFAGRSARPRLDLLIYLPKAAARPAPAFLGLNFCGNACTTNEPDVALSDAWMRNNPADGITDHRATERTRGKQAERWQIETVVDRGYAVVTAYYGDLFPDHDGGVTGGVHPLFLRKGQTQPGPDEWGAIGAWAWGLSRALDHLQTERAIDARRVAVVGHSRLGKAALWAGALDTRFALVISNDSGAGGAALSRRIFGETVGHLNRKFPHWFARNFHRYSDDEAALPVDQHMLLALIAPRPLYVASASEDTWADPRGEFLAARHASPVWTLFGKRGLPPDAEFPPVDRPIADGEVAYHVRTGKHDVTAYDWDQYLAFADRHLRAPPRPARR